MLKKISEEDIQRYAHQIILKNIGIDGQKKLLISKVFILGMGGLGSPVSMYLTSAGIGTLGIADFDNVELSNLQRQVLFDQKSINKSKVEIAKKKLLLMNPKLKINVYKNKITKENVDKIIKKYDVIVDGSDNFETKYLINDSCVKNKKTLISAALRGFEAQITTIKGWVKSKNNPCYEITQEDIYAVNGEAFFLYSGFPLTASQRGLYRVANLGSGRTEWIHEIEGRIEPPLAFSPSGCKVAYFRVSRLGDSLQVKNLCQ